MDLENFPENETAKEMMTYITKGFYDNSYVGKWLFEVMGQELLSAQNLLKEIKEQIYPEKATWGIKYHEIKYGLPINEKLSEEERRNKIIIKRDTRMAITPWRMEDILKKLTGYEVIVKDNITHPNTFTVTFKNEKYKIDFLKVLEQINKIKQSHVAMLEMKKETKQNQEIFYSILNTTSKKVNILIGE